jgi:hypothetical protein
MGDRTGMPRLNGKQGYDAANEGIGIQPIRDAVEER